MLYHLGYQLVAKGKKRLSLHFITEVCRVLFIFFFFGYWISVAMALYVMWEIFSWLLVVDF